MRTWLRAFWPFLILGPITGPLAAGLVACARTGRPWMAGVYALAIVEVWLGLPAVLARELAFVAHLGV